MGEGEWDYIDFRNKARRFLSSLMPEEGELRGGRKSKTS